MNLFLIFQYGLVGAFVVLLGTFLFVMVSESVEGGVSQLFGLSAKNETLTFLGIGMGGVLIALQALMSYRRAKALEDTANAQAEAAKAQAKATEEQAKANQNTEQGQRQERLKNAIEHLGHASDSVRLGGAYELFHLAEDTVEDTKDLRQTVLDILCAHIRRTTGEDEYRKKYPSKPSEEIQSLLTLLFVQKHEVFKGLHINLQGSWLNGADLLGARLEKAVMPGAYLQRALLCGAQLHGANLSEARLHGANLDGVRLHRANLEMTHLHWASLREAELHRTRLFLARLYGAALEGAQLYEANLAGAQLHAATLGAARLHRATLMGTDLRGATLLRVQALKVDFGKTPLQGARSEYEYWSSGIEFEKHIRRQIAKDSELSQVFFAGGLSQEDVYSAGKGLPDDEARELREELEGHIDQPTSFQLPTDSMATTGAYTAEEAERWIAEYNEAMSEVPEESDN